MGRAGGGAPAEILVGLWERSVGREPRKAWHPEKQSRQGHGLCPGASGRKQPCPRLDSSLEDWPMLAFWYPEQQEAKFVSFKPLTTRTAGVPYETNTIRDPSKLLLGKVGEVCPVTESSARPSRAGAGPANAPSPQASRRHGESGCISARDVLDTHQLDLMEVRKGNGLWKKEHTGQR